MSNASPAASSSVVPSRSECPRSRTARSSVCPPLASRQRNGGSSGSFRDRATRHVLRGGRPGRAGACPSTPWPSHGRDPDEQRADETGALSPRAGRRRRASRPRRPAPGERQASPARVAARGDLGHDTAVPRVEDRLRGDDRRKHFAPSVTTAAAVSSHDVSIPRITMMQPRRQRDGGSAGGAGFARREPRQARAVRSGEGEARRGTWVPDPGRGDRGPLAT